LWRSIRSGHHHVSGGALRFAEGYEMAGVVPRDIHFAEVHDCFTIAEIVALEELGFIERGLGGPWTASVQRRVRARSPSRLGGLKSKGHPVGDRRGAESAISSPRSAVRPATLQLKRNALGLAQNLGVRERRAW